MSVMLKKQNKKITK